jgi:hypothetical protein
MAILKDTHLVCVCARARVHVHVRMRVSHLVYHCYRVSMKNKCGSAAYDSTTRWQQSDRWN